MFEATSIPTLSDDSGLEVFSLKMRPGVFSARYAGGKVSYEEVVYLLWNNKLPNRAELSQCANTLRSLRISKTGES